MNSTKYSFENNDTHFTSEIESSIRSMWGFDCFFSSFSSNSRGVSILFNNNFEYEVLKEKRDLNGNYLALDVVIDKPWSDLNDNLVQFYSLLNLSTYYQEKEKNQVELVRGKTISYSSYTRETKEIK
jgi:hypothetical protein